ncbi:MAG: ankyrin repeat domain-containing protein [Verrucomicrobiales bacterium]|nr:ankyrin repeat domain-containing protein [Verrucomicrobiales bacterium]
MSDPVANRTLELACTVGALDDAIEAVEEGADINFQGGAPLFLAISNRNRELIEFLLDQGAEAEMYLSKKKLNQIEDRTDLVEELISCAPYNPRDVKPQQIEEIDSAIRSAGVEYLLSDIDWDKATRFRDSLNAIGAGSSHRCVAEFLQWARSETKTDPESLGAFLHTHNPTVSEYRDRYVSTGEDLVALANDYVSDGDETQE